MAWAKIWSTPSCVANVLCTPSLRSANDYDRMYDNIENGTSTASNNAAANSLSAIAMRTPGLEPGWVAPPAPKAGASTNFATSARQGAR